MYYLFLMELLFVLFALWLTWLGWGYFRRMRLWKEIQATPFPPEYEAILQKIPHYRLLPDELKRKLHDSIRFFMATKEFRGVEMAVTDEVRVTIAFYACLAQLGRQECYEGLRTIIVYPNDVVTRRVEAAGGIYREGDFVLEGESAGGTVVIAWNEAKKEAYHPRGHNVIIHELAHELDYEDGAADGVPPLAPSHYYSWTHTMFETYKKLKNAYERGRYLEKYKLLGSYAATSEAEFFAVVSELFFEKPWALKKHFPDLYNELQTFYGLDTATLFAPLEKERSYASLRA